MSEHHHRSLFKQPNKPFKGKSRGRHKNKGGKEAAEDNPRRAAQDVKTRKSDRLNKNKQVQQSKRQDAQSKARIGSRQGAPRNVALVALNGSADVLALQSALVGYAAQHAPPSREPKKKGDVAMAVEEDKSSAAGSSIPFAAHSATKMVSLMVDKRVHRFALTAVPRQTDAVLDAAKVADLIIFVSSAADAAGGSVPDGDADMVSVASGAAWKHAASASQCNAWDELGQHFLSIIKSQGLPASVTVLQHLASVPAKHQLTAKRNFALAMESALPSDPKMFVLDSLDDCSQFFRWISNLKLKQIQWRDARSYMLAESANFVPDGPAAPVGTLLVSGYLRGDRQLSANQLVHLTGFGDFQLSQIDGFVADGAATPLFPGAPTTVAPTALGSQHVMLQRADPSKQESLESLIPANPLATTGMDQSIITDEELKEAEDSRKAARAEKKKDIQSVWDDLVPEEADTKDEDGDDLDANMHDNTDDAMDDAALPSADDMDRDAEEFVSNRKDKQLPPLETKQALEKDEIMWPDEVDIPRHALARKRFEKYRGLKNLRATKWDKFENLPVEYHRIFSFERFAQTRKRVMASLKSNPVSVAQSRRDSTRDEDIDMSSADHHTISTSTSTANANKSNSDALMDLDANGAQMPSTHDEDGSQSTERYGVGVDSGTHVVLHIRVPVDIAQRIAALFVPGSSSSSSSSALSSSASSGALTAPLLVWGLLEFEHKVSVLHFAVHRHNEDEDIPIKGKEPMIFHYGFRRFTGRPVYSQHTHGVDKYLVERFFSKDRWSVASVYGRIMFPPAPVLMFRAPMANYADAMTEAAGGIPIAPGISIAKPYNPLAATGTLHTVDPHRLLIKRTILTGYPTWCARRSAVVRFMFFNPEDVRWFKPVELRTKMGCTGVIHEPRGTKGYMKCSFDRYIKQNDIVCMHLYKRQYPPWPDHQFVPSDS